MLEFVFTDMSYGELLLSIVFTVILLTIFFKIKGKRNIYFNRGFLFLAIWTFWGAIDEIVDGELAKDLLINFPQQIFLLIGLIYIYLGYKKLSKYMATFFHE